MLDAMATVRPARRNVLLALIWAALLLPAAAQEPYSVEPVTAKGDAYLPQSLVEGLDPAGVRVGTTSDGLSAVVCEIWWAKTISTQKPPSPASKDVLYGNIKPGELVGVIRFLPETS